MLPEDFQKAAKDYYWLINRDYNEFSARKFVGDHYALSGSGRSMLLRGIFVAKDSNERKKRLLPPAGIKEHTLHIDTLNVVYTINAYLRGKTVFVATDGLLRDAAEYHGKRINREHLQKCMFLLFEYLVSAGIGCADFFVDKPLHNSSFIVGQIRELLEKYRMKGEVEQFDSPDELLWKMKEGVLCTSDSEIISRSELAVFDLARNLLSYHFNPDFYELEKFL